MTVGSLRRSLWYLIRWRLDSYKHEILTHISSQCIVNCYLDLHFDNVINQIWECFAVHAFDSSWYFKNDSDNVVRKYAKVGKIRVKFQVQAFLIVPIAILVSHILKVVWILSLSNTIESIFVVFWNFP